MDSSLDLTPLRQQRMALEARHAETRRAYDALHARVVEHQARVAWQPEVKGVLETLQAREHERAVGAYEQLLTAFLQDVLPGPREVVMDLHSHGGMPALDIFLRKGKGQPLEDVFHGTGGSISNVVSAGLRAIALMRSGRRRFLVLDEADCWIKPSWAPRFAGVIQQMATQMGVQVLMISHHDESLFPMIPQRVRLERHAQGLAATWSPGAEAPQWRDDQAGLRSIILEDFQAHALTHLPLGPGVTLLCGDNDLGKSAIVTALRAVFLGEGKDTVIRHHQKTARVTLDFGPDHLLRWERHAKGKIKESYRHYTAEQGADEPLRASNSAQVPDWLDPTFGIGLIDGLDVQLGHQKSPIFLLDKPSTLRAKALAIGQDAGHVQAMMAIEKRETAEAKAAIRQGEAQLEQASRIIQSTGAMAARRGEWERLEEMAGSLAERRRRQAQMEQLRARWARALARRDLLASLAGGRVPDLPVLKANPAHAHLARRWRRARRQLAAVSLLGTGTDRQVPVLRAGDQEALARRWARAKGRMGVLGPLLAARGPLPPQAPRPVGRWAALAGRWRGARARREALDALVRQPIRIEVPVEHATTLEALRARWQEGLGLLDRLQADKARLLDQERALAQDVALCPTCGQDWSPGGRGRAPA